MKILCVATIFLAHFWDSVHSHGRMMNPPMRASIWRFPEFQQFNPPINYDDDGYYCGSMSTQYNENGGKCGLCGDNWADPVPRENEDKGFYGRGIIVRNYTEGQIIPLEVELTAAHLGHFEFHLCARNSRDELETEECFHKHILQLENGSYKFFVGHRKGKYFTKGILPQAVTCSRCVIRWHYRAGNNWGHCGNGIYDDGCGDQETFRGCSDVAITK